MNNTWLDRERAQTSRDDGSVRDVVVGNDDVWVVVHREDEFTDEAPPNGSWEIVAPLRVCREVRDGYVILGEADQECEADGPDFGPSDPGEA